jgi:hypothetical protein
MINQPTTGIGLYKQGTGSIVPTTPQPFQILDLASMAKYKPTDYSRQADGSVILNAGVTPIAGTYKPAPVIPSQLPAANLMSATNVQPAVNDTSSYDQAYAKGLEMGNNKSIADFQAQQEAQKVADQSTLSASEKAFNDLVAQISGKGKAQSDLQASLGVTDMTKQLADVNAQLAAKTGEFNSLINQNRGKAINSRIIGGTEDRLVRQKGIETGTLSSIAQAIQGNISTAKQTAEDTIAFQYAPLENELELKKMQLERAYDTFDASEKKRADQLLQVMNEQKAQITAEKAVKSKINDIMISASKNGADAETLKAIMASKDEQSATLAAGNFLEASDFAVNAKTGQLYNKKTGETIGASVAKSSGSKSGSVSNSSKTTNTSSTDTTVDNWVDLLEKGQATISNIPKTIVSQVVKRVSERKAAVNKPLSDTAVKEITQTKSALASLNVLEQKIKDNLQYVGPITGLQALNPFSPARKVQADVDRVRQTVGKALEGGVLRKEDEEKYKKILATLTDTPETAIYKIQALKDTLNRDIQAYEDAQRSSGRYVQPSATPTTAEDLRKKYGY